MAPGRSLKRQKTNNSVDQLVQTQSPLQNPRQPDPPTPKPSDEALSDSSSLAQAPERSSWYGKTWPRKAAPVTEIARETVSSTSNTTGRAVSAVIGNVTPKVRTTKSPSLAMTLGKAKSNQLHPVNATTTKIHAMPEPASTARKHSKEEKSSEGLKFVAADKQKQGAKLEETALPQGEVVKPVAGISSKAAENPQAEPQAPKASWLMWLSKNETTAGIQADQDQAVPSKPPEMLQREGESVDQADPTQAQSDLSQTEGSETANNKRSWLQMWGNDMHGPVPPATPDSISSQMEPKIVSIKPQAHPKLSESPPASGASSIETSAPPALPGDGTKSSGWVFWSRERKGNNGVPQDGQPHVGEIAISDTPSEARPKRTSISLKEGNDPQKPNLKHPIPEIKRPATPQKDLTATKDFPPIQEHKKTDSRTSNMSAKAESANASAVSKEPTEIRLSRPASPAPIKASGPNLLLPAFRETLRLQENPSILQQLARLLYYTEEPKLKHVSLVSEPPRVRNALAIGVHGYFPAPLIRSVLGQPTGTSIKFADMAAKSIKRWTTDHGYDCQVKTAALEGEGKIAERIELLWKLLLNWIDEIRRADFVMIACHSQGVPVAIMLVAKLIQFGCLNAARVGICAMAGVNMGPFQDYKSRWISGSAGELFEFSDPNSRVSTDYRAALEDVLKFGVRLSFVGSIDDQLVSLDSSTFSPITHPNIYRAVLIDSRVHAPNFLSHLVGFVFKLRNLGVQDHGLIRELSSPLAGSLYTGEGHSRIYDDDAVYDLAVAFALETTAVINTPLSLRPLGATAGNPYILPFAMRGILEEEFVKTQLQHEATELLQQFDDWKPTTKVLKDVKFRLEGIRSRL